MPYVATTTPNHATRKVTYECIQCESGMTYSIGDVLPMRCQKCGYRILRKKRIPLETVQEDPATFAIMKPTSQRVFLAR